MSMNEILASIRETLSEELGEKPNNDNLDAELDDIFILTPGMRVDDVKISLEEKMRRVLEKMSAEPLEQKKTTISNELQPLLKKWMQQMRPDLTDDAVLGELKKILPN